MSARVSVGAPAASPAAMTDGRTGNGASARGTSLLDTAGSAGAAVNTDAGPNDSAGAAGSRAGPFAAALANATRGGGSKGADTSGAHSEATPASTAAAEGARLGVCVGGPAAQSAGAQQSDAAQSADTTQTLEQTPSAATSLTMSAPANSPAVAAAAAAIAAATGAATGAAAAPASQSAGPASGAQAGSADGEEPISTDSTAPSTEAHGGHIGRSSARSEGTDGSAGTGWCALALLQSAAASLGIPCQPAVTSTAGATSEQQDEADGPAIGGALNVLAGATGGGANLPAKPSSTGASAASPANASMAAKLVAAQTVSELLSGTGTGTGTASGNDVMGTTPSLTHGTADAADATGQSSAAARAASWMPQFLAASPAAAGSDGVARAISVPMSDRSWPQALAAQVHWMAGSQVQSATLSLSPQHLGPIQVRIDLQQSQINVNFSAAHADTRAALADAMPRLREMLAAGGLSLGQANVQQQSAGGGSAAPPLSSAMRASAETVDPVAVGVSHALGLVDEYV